MSAHERMRLAIARIRLGKPKTVSVKRSMSYKAVGEEAGVAYQNLYKEGFEDLKSAIDIVKRECDKTEITMLQKKKRKKDIRLKELNLQVRDLKSKLERAAIVNFNLSIENERLKEKLHVSRSSKIYSLDL